MIHLSSEEEGRYFLVLELVEGTSLQRLVRQQQPLPEAQLWNLLHQGLGILDYLHHLRPPVVHRDIKPANLIQRPDGRLALVDVGGVRVALRPDGGSTMVGTFGYMAPEQLHGEATPATDIYGLGLVLDTMHRDAIAVLSVRLMEREGSGPGSRWQRLGRAWWM